jgi:hypothetical protein
MKLAHIALCVHYTRQTFPMTEIAKLLLTVVIAGSISAGLPLLVYYLTKR